MKLSANTLTILKNFADINSNLTIRPGNTLKTIHVPPTIYATAQVEETFDRTFGVYDLKEFLATLAMFKNPSLTFTDEYIEIVDDDDASIKTQYWSADVKILTEVPALKAFPQPTTTFMLTNVNFKRIEKACSILKCPDVVIKGGEGKIVATVCDLSNGTKNSFAVTLEDNYTGPEFNVHVRQEKLMNIDGDYTCNLINNQLIEMNHTSKNVQYVVTLDA